MQTKAHILIVEDKAILYKRIAMFLKENFYSVASFTPSVDAAIGELNKKSPDLVLLDIQLQGDKTGIDLGKKLAAEYGIPFIYVTDYGDDETFYKSLATQHSQFLVKTKPHLDTKVLLRAIQTVLAQKPEVTYNTKESFLCYTGYINEVKQRGVNTISKIPVSLSEITCITTKDINDIKLKPNYVQVITHNKKVYFLPVSLSEILTSLPIQFVRINESEIVNISEDILDGRINGTRIKIGKKIHHISKTYKSEVEKRFKLLYHSF